MRFFVGHLGQVAIAASAVLLTAAIAACGGGGGASPQAPPPAVAITFPKPSPSPTLAPSPTPASCAALVGLRMHARLMQRRGIAAIPRRAGPGPASRVCADSTAGHMHCMGWVRTDVMRPLSSGPIAYGPSDLQTAYNLTTASSTNGSTQIVAIVDAFDDPNAEADLAVYRSTFALSSCTTANGCFLKVNQSGLTAPLPGTDPDPKKGWEGEESLDLDMVSAICPNCDIVLLEANSTLSTDLYTAEDTAATTCGATVISDSWGGSEYSSERADEGHFNHSGVMITVASGDLGYRGATSGYPAASQFVTSVGGTSLFTSPTRSEVVWAGTGSECSQYIAQPSWQTSLGSAYTSVCGNRIENDVAAVADPNTGVAVYDSFGGSCSGWCIFGGTSAAAPIIAGVYALAGNGGSLTAGSYSYAHLGSLFDITSGSNGSCSGTFLCTARAGYDGPTGNGSPNGIGAF